MKIRSLLMILLCLLLIIWIFPVSANTKEAIITEDNLNLRSGPGTDYDKLGQVHKDEVYPIVQEQGSWIEIRLDDYTAWVSTDYVSMQGDVISDSQESPDGLNENDTQDSGDTTNKPNNQTVRIPFDNTQIRSGPSTDNDIIYFAKEGEQLPLIGETDHWLKVEVKESTGYVFKELVETNVEFSSEGLEGKTIVIDPGHGGDDSGALSPNQVYEKDLTYKSADILAHELTVLGADVIMTRDQETFVSLASRATLSNTVNADAFVSLHYNSVPDLPDVTGIGTYYFHEQYEPLARYIQQEIIKESGDRDRGSDFGDFQVIRQNLTPGVLIELGFISNPEIEQLLLTNAYQEKLVSGIVNGLQRYFSEQN